MFLISIYLIAKDTRKVLPSTNKALKKIGFNNLIITSPKLGWPNIKAKATSVGAFDILNKTKVFNNTISAIKNFEY